MTYFTTFIHREVLKSYSKVSLLCLSTDFRKIQRTMEIGGDVKHSGTHPKYQG